MVKCCVFDVYELSIVGDKQIAVYWEDGKHEGAFEGRRAPRIPQQRLLSTQCEHEQRGEFTGRRETWLPKEHGPPPPSTRKTRHNCKATAESVSRDSGPSDGSSGTLPAPSPSSWQQLTVYPHDLTDHKDALSQTGFIQEILWWLTRQTENELLQVFSVKCDKMFYFQSYAWKQRDLLPLKSTETLSLMAFLLRPCVTLVWN